jgi:hypothetical protein
VFVLSPWRADLALVAGVAVTVVVRVGSRLTGMQLPVPRTPDA